MNKAETVKQLAKQTVIQENDLKNYLTKEIEELKAGMVKLAEIQNNIMNNQLVLHQTMENLSKTETKVNLTPILTELIMIKKQNKSLKKQFLINFLLVQVPLLAVLVAYLVVLAVTRLMTKYHYVVSLKENAKFVKINNNEDDFFISRAYEFREINKGKVSFIYLIFI